jgi:hypothetical protein
VQWTHLQYKYQGMLSHPPCNNNKNILSWGNCLPRSSEGLNIWQWRITFVISLDYFMLSPLSVPEQAVMILTCILRFLLES